jgi:hypothetical protein
MNVDEKEDKENRESFLKTSLEMGCVKEDTGSHIYDRR